MFEHIRVHVRLAAIPLVLILVGGLLATAPVQGGEKKTAAQAGAITEGQRVYTCAHSFHFFVPPILADMAAQGGIKGHQSLGLSAIGGSRVDQHWKEAMGGDKFKAKETLRSGKVDVLTLSPIFMPDDGIDNFAKLALEHNPKIRVTVQESWLPFDTYNLANPLQSKKVDHNAPTAAELRKLHEPYFKSLDEYVRGVNKKLGKDVVWVVPMGHAVVALREKIILGQAPGLKVQEDLFTDAIGHPKPVLQALEGYLYFAVVYRRTPVGLGMPAILKGKNAIFDEKLNRVLQELAWEAATQHPLSGVAAAK